MMSDLSKRFMLMTADDGEAVRGPLLIEDVYIMAFGTNVEKGQKHPVDLDVGESVLRRYKLVRQGDGTYGPSGNHNVETVCKVVRLADGLSPPLAINPCPTCGRSRS